MVLALLAVLAAIETLLPMGRSAVACSLARATLDQAAREAEIIIVGEVTSERRVQSGTHPVYESTVRVGATLKGSADREIALSKLGILDSDCTGGPRLRTGERVLLFLYDWQGLTIYAHEDGRYLLTRETAKTRLDPPIPLEGALRRVAAITDAPRDQLDAALAFARREPPPAPKPEIEPLPVEEEEDGGLRALLIGLSSAVAVAVLASAAWYARRRWVRR